jgi:alkanesulfonate monooxygenase SsuD/methylene tetrahydromethanopterin reductase-like flavin-dependent oxidoreductase (luciferase family)
MPVVRYGISVAHTELEDKPGLAKLADEAGFAAIWNSAESIPLFGAMAMETKQAKIGSGVLRAFGHDVRNLVQHTMDLQRLSGGRWILGLGGGTPQMNVNLFGQRFEHPATRLRELIEILRLTMTTPSNQQFSYEGTYYQLRGSGFRDLLPAPVPLYLAAVNPTTLRLTGERCDGICGHPIASVPFIQNVVWPALDEGLQRSGRTRADFDHASWIITAVSNDRSQALRELKQEVGRFMATRSFSIIPDSQGLEQVRLEIQDAFRRYPGDAEKLIAAVPDEVAAAHGIYGTKDDVRQQIQRYEGAIDTPTFYCPPIRDKARAKENLLLIIETFGK